MAKQSVLGGRSGGVFRGAAWGASITIFIMHINCYNANRCGIFMDFFAFASLEMFMAFYEALALCDGIEHRRFARFVAAELGTAGPERLYN